jgi:hypothetical protein
LAWQDHVPSTISDLYEIHDYKHAAAVISAEFPEEWSEIIGALSKFRFKTVYVTAPGGNESQIPKRISAILRPLGWVEKQLHARLLVDETEVSHDTHKVDYCRRPRSFLPVSRNIVNPIPS